MEQIGRNSGKLMSWNLGFWGGIRFGVPSVLLCSNALRLNLIPYSAACAQLQGDNHLIMLKRLDSVFTSGLLEYPQLSN